LKSDSGEMLYSFKTLRISLYGFSELRNSNARMYQLKSTMNQLRMFINLCSAISIFEGSLTA
jgi:hypothetical protein